MPNPGSFSTGQYRDWQEKIDKEAGQIHVDRAKLKELAGRLEHHLSELLSADEKLHPAPEAAFGRWDAARSLYPSVQAGHKALVEQHSRVLHALMEMIEKLNRTAQVHDETESALKQRIANIDRRMGA